MVYKHKFRVFTRRLNLDKMCSIRVYACNRKFGMIGMNVYYFVIKYVHIQCDV